MKTLKVLIFLFFSVSLLLTTSCNKEDKPDKPDNPDNPDKPDTSDPVYAMALTQLNEDYTNVTSVVWKTQRGYQIATFSGTKTRAEAQNMTAWYAVSETKATLAMDSEDLGTTVPDIITTKGDFAASKYSDATKWEIKEIELEHNYDDDSDVVTKYYEMELESIGTPNPNLEAELLFDFTTGALIFSKEDEADNDDSDDDKYVITTELKAAVEEAVPGATIIEAEVDDNLIEVDAIITVNEVKKEIELKFTMAYVLDSSETETEYKYGELPAKFSAIGAWFAANTATPVPVADTEIEITEGTQTDDDDNIGEYYYEVEIDDYDSGGEKYEVEFYLSKEATASATPEIIAVIVNDVKISSAGAPDRSDTHLEGFAFDFPEADNVVWKVDDLGYNYVTFDLNVTKAATTYNAEAWYDDVYINFLTQEYIPVSEVPSDIVAAALEAEGNDPTVTCVEAIRATCKESVYYKLLLESDIRTYIYTICNKKVATYDESDLDDLLLETKVPKLYAMRYIEENYDYCLTDDAYTETSFGSDEADKNGYTVPLFLYDKDYLAEIVFVNDNIEFVRELHYLTKIHNTSETLPETVPEDIRNAVYDYMMTANHSDVEYRDMVMWCNSEGEAEDYYLNFSWQSGRGEIKIMPNGSITVTQ